MAIWQKGNFSQPISRSLKNLLKTRGFQYNPIEGYPFNGRVPSGLDLGRAG